MKNLHYLILPLLILSSIEVSAIVGGVAENDADWPYFLSLRTIENGQIKHRCGGAYIGEGIIMTAAHCIPLVPAGAKSVACIGGSGDAADNNCYQLTKSIAHPDFNSSTNEADLGLYKMKKIPYQYPTPRLVTAEQDSLIKGGELIQYIGLGSTSWSSYIPSPILLGTQLNVLDGEACLDTLNDDISDIGQFICTETIGLPAYRGVAPGDSGSPAFVQTEQGWRYAALVSSGLATRLGVHLDWIETTASQLSTEDGLYFEKNTYWILNAEESTDELINESADESIDEIVENSLEQVEFVLTNKSATQLSQRLELPATSPFTIISDNCTTIASQQSCTVTLEFNPEEQDEPSSELRIVQDNGNTLIANLIALRLQPLQAIVEWQETWKEAGDSYWQASDRGGLNISNDFSDHQVLESEITGPVNMAFSAQVKTLSGEGSVQVRLDDELVYQVSGLCDARNLVVNIPEGEHNVRFEYFSSDSAEEIDNIELYAINFSESTLASGSLRCSYNSIESVRSQENSGGGSVAFISMFMLSLGLFFRRFRYTL